MKSYIAELFSQYEYLNIFILLLNYININIQNIYLYLKNIIKMVRSCPYNYPKSQEEPYKIHYSNYSYELHDFQKWAIQGIVEGNHVLICAPTGSGKTMPGEFAVDYFYKKGKKTIYTSPIKALSNEKFYNFTQKYPDISIGLITGDIKTNPDADVLIMTTEILLNKLYQIKSKTTEMPSSISFEMNIETELGCVIFDEIHMINDEHRGHVWEQCIMLLPEQIQMIGLSATLDDPERFACWLETKGDITTKVDKIVYLTKKLVRSVPLVHYSFITVTNTINKVIKDKDTQEKVKQAINKPFIIQDEHGSFNEQTYSSMVKTLDLFEKNNVYVKRQHVINKVTEYLVEKEMLPALCYVFNRKQLEKCACEVTTNLLEFDSKIPNIIDSECERIIRKLPNFEEYLYLPEYLNIVKLLRKGVGIHHAGLMPILREMVELLFTKGYIKVLFCTETMSVGINLPVKTTIFTDVNKFNGVINRMLYSHEYTQAAGRAGRLGLDTIGHVIHLNNLFRNVDKVSYKLMMNGKPQTLVSKFKISYNLLLNLINIGNVNIINFAQKSMVTNELDNQKKEIYYKITKYSNSEESGDIIIIRTPQHIIQEYNDLLINRQNSINKKRKEIDRKINSILEAYKFIEKDRVHFNNALIKEKEYNDLKNQYDVLNSYVQNGIDKVFTVLNDCGFIHNTPFTLTDKGLIASQLRETHCLVFSRLIKNNVLDTLDTTQLVMLFSCFTNITIPDDLKNNKPKVTNTCLLNIIEDINNSYNYYQKIELDNNINAGIDYSIHYDLMEYILEWCNAENVEDCKIILQKMVEEKQIFLGEFVKAILKINNISHEIEKIADMFGMINLLSKLKEIPVITLKYVVTNQSLYV